MTELEQEARAKGRRQLAVERRTPGRQLKAWWMAEMLAAKNPLTERLLLFWSNHFTSSLRTALLDPAYQVK